MAGPTLPISVETHALKYREDGETYEKAMKRIAFAMKDDEPHYKAFLSLLMDMVFLPAGRIQAAMGATKIVTPYNCFVSGTIDDSFIEGTASIMARATEAAATMRVGGGIGYDFSTLRNNGALIRKLGSRSSGPVSFMHIFDAICKCIASAGHRRGAQMAVLRVDHPDILEFVRAKQNGDVLTGFNMSVGVTHQFMEHLASGKPFPLQFGGQIHSKIDPRELWDEIMRSTWDWAEPGVLFIDTINDYNNLWYAEKIAATNPCGEQPLPPHGACLLGSINLPKLLTKSRKLDYDRLEKAIPHIVRAMDNVIDRAEYPLPQQGREARAKRRMGIGVTGLANCIEAMGYPYGSPDFIREADEILRFINHHCYLASTQLAREKGCFALFDKRHYLESKFVQTLDEEVQEAIAKFGIRNSHLTSIAPTGTISLCADNVSSGIEPVFSHSYDRTIQTFEGPRVETVTDYGLAKLGVKGKTAEQVTLDEHLNVLLVAAKNVDSAVSKTCNVGDQVTFDEFKQLYLKAYEGGAKGCTTFRAAGKRMGILVAKTEEAAPSDVMEGDTCQIDPTTGRRSCE
jgi:ribonucleoside-diphosphate reductase alpha chain